MSKMSLFSQNVRDYEELTRDLLPLKLRDWLISEGYFTQVASKGHHGNTIGGLFDHSYAVTTTLLELTRRLHLQWKRPESPIIVGLLHDVCKLYLYKYDKDGNIVINEDRQFKGHGSASVQILQKFIDETHCMVLTDEEVACIRYHMGAFTNKEEWSEYSAAVHKYPNVLWTHTADMYASNVEDK